MIIRPIIFDNFSSCKLQTLFLQSNFPILTVILGHAAVLDSADVTAQFILLVGRVLHELGLHGESDQI